MIGLRNVSKIYGENIVAVQGVNLGVRPGEFAFIVGPSGSGKSTLVRLLLKEIEPTSGSVHVNGQRLGEIPRRKVPHHRRSIGCVFQDFKLLPNKTAAENVAYAMEVTGYRRSAIRGTVPQILDLVDLGDKTGRYLDQLSGGEQQRVSIARAFVTRPPIIVADEPTGNIDPETGMEIMRVLEKINGTGTTVLVATHDREIVNAMHKRVVALDEGRVVRDRAQGAYADEA